MLTTMISRLQIAALLLAAVFVVLLFTGWPGADATGDAPDTSVPDTSIPAEEPASDADTSIPVPGGSDDSGEPADVSVPDGDVGDIYGSTDDGPDTSEG